MSLYFALLTVENNKNKKSVKFQGDMLNYCDFIQVFVFTTNHHLKMFSETGTRISLLSLLVSQISHMFKALQIGCDGLSCVWQTETS